MPESGDYVETVFVAEVSGELCARFFVVDDTSSEYSDGIGAVLKGGVEVLPERDARVDSGLP